MNPHYPNAGQYLAACRRAFATTKAGGTVRLFWSSPELDLAGWRREFIRALFARMDAKAGTVHKGRKWDSDYQRHMMNDGRAINTPRLIVRTTTITTDDWRTRFAHRLTDNNECY